MKGFHIKRFIAGSLLAAVLLSAIFLAISVFGMRYFHETERATEQYLLAEKSAQKLQEGSDILTEQVRLYVMTGQKKYMDSYFQEAKVTCRRENAVAELRGSFADTVLLSELEAALNDSKALMAHEFYAMRLAFEAFGGEQDELPEEVAAVTLTRGDSVRTDAEKLSKAHNKNGSRIYGD